MTQYHLPADTRLKVKGPDVHIPPLTGNGKPKQHWFTIRSDIPTSINVHILP